VKHLLLAAFAASLLFATSAGEPLTLNLAEYGSGIGSWCVYGAQDQDAFTKAGIKLDNILTLTGDPNIVSALLSGQADIAMGSVGSIVPVANGQTDQIVIIASSEGAPVSLVTAKSVTAPAQLAGKTIALPAHNTSNELIGEALLDQLLGAGKWTPLYVGGTASARIAAIAAGKADAAFVNDPVDLRTLPDYRVLTRFGARQIYLNGPVLSTRNWLRDHHEAAVRFLAAYAKGCNFILDPKNRQAATGLLVTRAAMPEPIAAEVYGYYVAGPARGKSPPRDGKLDLAGLAATIDVLKKAGIITNPAFDYRSAVDTRYLEEALRGGHS